MKRKILNGINFAAVGRTLGILVLFEAAFMIVPALVALFAGESGAFKAFGLSAMLTAICGWFSYHYIRPSGRDMGRRESVLLTASVWIVFSLFGQIPYMLAPSTHLNFSAAFFEAMSGFTTTGASLVESTDNLSYAVHIWRCLSQWIGGLGIIIFTLALVPMLNSSGGMQMFNAEQNKISVDKIRPRISSTARRLWMVYVLLTFTLFLLLWAGPMNAFEAACHAMSTLSTGGFSTSSEGINVYNSIYVKATITLFMFLGGVNFAMIYRASTGQHKAVLSNEAFITYCRVILFATLLFIIGILLNGSFSGWQSVTIDPLFQVVSLVTSTGFMLSDFKLWGPSVLYIGLLLIFMGGCAGSTSGGAKIDRVVYLLKFLRNEVKRTLRPNSIMAVRVSGRTVPTDRINNVVAFLCLYVLIIIVGGLTLTFCGAPLADSFVSAFAAIGNASLATTDSAVGCNYVQLNAGAHYVLAFLMLVGRLELFTILILFSRSFWQP
ncbi:MAG: TrkH family potassium uptake protein [Muribaculaceae bacterium]|nr:TrkH family potassium uptake protein [Muribaculaceae bacterium]